MVKEFHQMGTENKEREMKNYLRLKEMGVSQQFVKIYEQNSEEA